MASIINLNSLTFTAEQVRDINELVFDEVLRSPDLNFLFTMFSDIVYDKEIGFITGGGLVGVKDQGCDPEPQAYSIGTRKVVWQPKGWEVFLSECYKDLENAATVYALNKGVRISDLTDTDYMAIVVKVLTADVKDAIFRFAFFADTEAENYDAEDAPTGIITPGVDTAYFDLIDGFWKQFQTAATSHPELLRTIAANSANTKASQLSGMTADAAYALLSDMYFKAPVAMRGKGRFLVTQTIADAYQQYLEGKGIEATYKNLVDGVQVLYFRGVEVVPMPKWDEMIQAYNDLGTTFYKPHRALLVEKENLAIGTPSGDAFGAFDMWHDKTTRKSYVLIQDKMDAKVLNDKRFVLGI